MWRGEEIPSLPMMTETSAFKDPSEFKPATVNDELEKLRQRGLAKKLSSYFAKEVEKLAEQKTKTEQALKELEARKAEATRSFANSNEISQLDDMYMKLQKFKRETSKKEKETLLLYQRSLQKYGNTVKVMVSPEDLMMTMTTTTPGKKGAAATAVPNNNNNNNNNSSSPISTEPVSELARAFETETGVPEFLCSKDSTITSKNSKQELEEILEECALPDPEGRLVRCESPKACGSGSITAMESDDFEFYDNDNDDDDDDDDDDLSVLTGLTTLNSAKTREVMHEVGTQVRSFIKTEKQEIQKMFDNEEPSIASRDAYSRTGGSIAEESAQASKAEELVDQMQRILKDYEQEASETQKQLLEMATPRRIETNSGTFYEHFDENYQRHYYVNATTNKAQWNAPPSLTGLSEDCSSSSFCESSTVVSADPSSSTTHIAPALFVSPDDFKPEARTIRKSTRINQYRAKRRRQRNRRIVAVASLGAALVCYKCMHPDASLLEHAPQKVIDTASEAIDWANHAQSWIEIPKDAIVPVTTKESLQSTNKGKSNQKVQPARKEEESQVSSAPTLSSVQDANETLAVVTEQEIDEMYPVKEAPKELIVGNLEPVKDALAVQEETKAAKNNKQAAEMEDKTVMNHVIQVLSGPLYITTEYLESQIMSKMH